MSDEEIKAALEEFLGREWLKRCDWCGWRLADELSKGCVADCCSQRPVPHESRTDLRRACRALLTRKESGS